MKKFERLPVESRRAEIQSAATKLFLEKGFRATTMENIVEKVTLSKGGVYRIYPSTKAILTDLIIDGMHERNAFYQRCAQELAAARVPIDISTIGDVIYEGMLLSAEVSTLYVELLVEKRHIPELELLYREICRETMKETLALMGQLHLTEPIAFDEDKLWRLTELMNTAILGIVILNHREDFESYKKAFLLALIAILK